jgi:hypothetical protein
MDFLRRLIGGSTRNVDSDAGSDDDHDDDVGTDPAELDAAERQHELDLLRGEQERLDELQQRQERYAQYAWQPPAQGGEIRAEDNDRSSGS